MEETSFQDLVCDISSGQRQKDVTLPFYFICLLHLANEKVTLFSLILFILCLSSSILHSALQCHHNVQF
jgi:hypothetical protein